MAKSLAVPSLRPHRYTGVTVVTLPAFLGLPGYQVCRVPGEQWTPAACGLHGGPERDAFTFCHGEGVAGEASERRRGRRQRAARSRSPWM